MGLYLMDLEIRFCFDYSITLVTGKSYTFMKILALEHESVLFFELIIAMITSIFHTFMDYFFVTFETGRCGEFRITMVK